MLGKLLHKYYKSKNHPGKLRILHQIIRLLNKLNFRVIIPYYNNTSISLNLKEYVDRTIFFNGLYEQEVYDSLMYFAEKDEILWDIGGHIGSFSLKALNDHRIKEIHCFEPDPSNFEILKQNKLINTNSEKLFIHNIGLSNIQGEVDFFKLNADNSGGNSFNEVVNAEKITATVDTINNLVYNKKIPSPTLIKVDVEGFEKNVIIGGIDTINQSPPKALIIETKKNTANMIFDPWFYQFFNNLGYEITEVFVKDEEGGELSNFIFKLNNNPIK